MFEDNFFQMISKQNNSFVSSYEFAKQEVKWSTPHLSIWLCRFISRVEHMTIERDALDYIE